MLPDHGLVWYYQSSVEPWFTDARVITSFTILQKESNPDVRVQNLVRFVSFHRPLSAFVPVTENEAIRQAAAEKFVRHIETVTADEQTAE